jgi:hypothetical protein
LFAHGTHRSRAVKASNGRSGFTPRSVSGLPGYTHSFYRRNTEIRENSGGRDGSPSRPTFPWGRDAIVALFGAKPDRQSLPDERATYHQNDDPPKPLRYLLLNNSRLFITRYRATRYSCLSSHDTGLSEARLHLDPRLKKSARKFFGAKRSTDWPRWSMASGWKD